MSWQCRWRRGRASRSAISRPTSTTPNICRWKPVSTPKRCIIRAASDTADHKEAGQSFRREAQAGVRRATEDGPKLTLGIPAAPDLPGGAASGAADRRHRCDHGASTSAAPRRQRRQHTGCENRAAAGRTPCCSRWSRRLQPGTAAGRFPGQDPLAAAATWRSSPATILTSAGASR